MSLVAKINNVEASDIGEINGTAVSNIAKCNGQELPPPPKYSANFNANQRMSRTWDVGGNAKKYTVATWVKPDVTSTTIQALFLTSSLNAHISFINGISDYSGIRHSGGGQTGFDGYLVAGEWHHITIAFDSAQTAEADRLRVWLDGVLCAKAWWNGMNNYPPQNATSELLQNGVLHYLPAANTWPYDGRLYDFKVIDGQALPADRFVSGTGANAKYKAYSGSYGAAGFWLDFADGSLLGRDVSGNENHFSHNGYQETDIPT